MAKKFYLGTCLCKSLVDSISCSGTLCFGSRKPNTSYLCKWPAKLQILLCCELHNNIYNFQK